MATNFKHGLESRGVPVNVDQRNMWGTTYFVDGGSGSNGNSGTDTSQAFASITQAIATATAQDTIYIRQRVPNTDATDPTPYLDNVTVPYAKYGVLFIGTGANTVNPFYVQVKGNSTGPVFAIHAPGTVVENLCLNNGASTTGIIRFNGDDDSANTAWGCLIANCHIRNAKTAIANAGIVGNAGSYNTIYGCTFVACFDGINIASGSTYPVRAPRIENCLFYSGVGTSGAEAVGGRHITLSGVIYQSVITGCHFDAIGTRATGKFVNLAGTGIMSNCHFGTTTDVAVTTTGNEITATTTQFVTGCYDDTGAMIATT